MLDGIDISNHQGPPEAYRDQPEYQAAQFVIAQAIPRPAPDGYTAAQLAAATEDGKHEGIYSWLWHDPSWRLGDQTVEGDQRARLATVPEDQPLHIRPYLDEEDNVSTNWNAVTIAQRKDDVLRALDVLDAFAARRGLPEAGIYWSQYYIDLLFGGDASFVGGRKQWRAHYGVPPGSLLNGNVVAHQYTSTPVDQNKMLESEIVNDPQGQPERTVDEVLQALSYIDHDVLKPLRSYKLAKVVKAVAEIDRVAAQYGAV